MLVYHILEDLDLIDGTFYRPKSYDKDGFIHLSFEDQYLRVAKSLYLDYDTLHLLTINTDLLEEKDKLVVEDLYDLNEEYPHYYEVLNTDCIVEIQTLIKVNNTFKKETINE